MKKRKTANLIMVLIIAAIVIAGVSAALMTRTPWGASGHPVCDPAEAIQIDFAACV